MRNHHELGECGQGEEQVVWAVQVGHLKPDRLTVEIPWDAKDHIQPDATQQSAREAVDDTVERGPTGLKLTFADAHLDHGLRVQNVDVAAPINEGPGEQT